MFAPSTHRNKRIQRCYSPAELSRHILNRVLVFFWSKTSVTPTPSTVWRSWHFRHSCGVAHPWLFLTASPPDVRQPWHFWHPLTGLRTHGCCTRGAYQLVAGVVLSGLTRGCVLVVAVPATPSKVWQAISTDVGTNPPASQINVHQPAVRQLRDTSPSFQGTLNDVGSPSSILYQQGWCTNVLGLW